MHQSFEIFVLIYACLSSVLMGFGLYLILKGLFYKLKYIFVKSKKARYTLTLKDFYKANS